MEEWSRVWRNGELDPRPSAVRNFEALPEVLRRIVGDPKQLADWERLGNDEIDTVLQSNFMRSFRARAAHEREYMALPNDVKQAMEALSSGMKPLALE
jgi:hypothetical protein